MHRQKEDIIHVNYNAAFKMTLLFPYNNKDVFICSPVYQSSEFIGGQKSKRKGSLIFLPVRKNTFLLCCLLKMKLIEEVKNYILKVVRELL